MLVGTRIPLIHSWIAVPRSKSGAAQLILPNRPEKLMMPSRLSKPLLHDLRMSLIHPTASVMRPSHGASAARIGSVKSPMNSRLKPPKSCVTPCHMSPIGPRPSSLTPKMSNMPNRLVMSSPKPAPSSPTAATHSLTSVMNSWLRFSESAQALTCSMIAMPKASSGTT